MQITKSEVIIFLITNIEMANGKLSNEEQNYISASPILASHLKNALDNGLSNKISNGQINEESIMAFLNELTLEERSEIMTVCFQTEISDTVNINEENKIILRLARIFRAK